MISKYVNQLKTAAANRHDAKLPNVRWLIGAIAIFTFIYCVAAVYLVPADKPAVFNFHEGGAITTMSAIFLSLACGFAIAAGIIHLRTNGNLQIMWVILALGFGFFAFDELLQFHERIGHQIKVQIWEQTIFRTWNDVIVIMYGVVAIPVVLVLLPRLLKHRMMLRLFAVAFAFYTLHTIIDSTQEPPTLMTNVFEESAKLFSGAFLMLGSFTGFLGNVWESIGEPKVETAQAESIEDFRTTNLKESFALINSEPVQAQPLVDEPTLVTNEISH